MENEGYIKLYRKMLNNPIICKDSDYFSVWIYLLLNATHSEYDVMFKNERITLKAGQLITGRKVIAKKFNIDENKVQRILKNLEKQHQIEQQTSTKNRLISIVNWSEYQIERHSNKQQVNNKRTTSEQQLNTNKNVKNIYIILFNKYKRLIQENPRRKILIIGDLKKELDYQTLSIEEQDQLFYDLMNPNK